MSSLEENLRSEDTATLQKKLLTNSYTVEAASIAKNILIERGDAIPIPESAAETERKINMSMRRSSQELFAVIAWAAISWTLWTFEHEPGRYIFWSGIMLASALGISKRK